MTTSDKRGMHNARPVAENGMLWCRDCEKFKVQDDFAVDRRDRNGRSTKCRACQKRKMDDYKARPGKTREGLAQRLRRNFAMTLEEYDALLECQDRVCAICHQENSQHDPKLGGNRRLHLDHDHSTGRVRGLLCHRCNSLLGMAGDSEEVLHAAVGYLRTHR